MPYLEIRVLKGSNLKQKRALMKNVTEAVAKSLGCPPESVAISLQEFPPENMTRR